MKHAGNADLSPEPELLYMHAVPAPMSHGGRRQNSCVGHGSFGTWAPNRLDTSTLPSSVTARLPAPVAQRGAALKVAVAEKADVLQRDSSARPSADLSSLEWDGRQKGPMLFFVPLIFRKCNIQQLGK